MSLFSLISRKSSKSLVPRNQEDNSKRNSYARLGKIYEDEYFLVFQGLKDFTECQRSKDLSWNPQRAKFELSRLGDDGFNPAYSMDNNEEVKMNTFSPQKVVPIYKEGEVFVKHYMPGGYYPNSIKEIMSKYDVRVIPSIPYNMIYKPESKSLSIFVPFKDTNMKLKVENGLPVEVLNLEDPHHLLAAAFYSVEYFEFLWGQNSDYKIYKPGPSYLAQFLNVPDLTDSNKWNVIENEVGNCRKSMSSRGF